LNPLAVPREPAAQPRQTTTPAIYRRRRLAALLAAGVLVVLGLLALRSCGDEPELAELGPREAHRARLAAEPVELTLSFSGDLLMHSPVFARALELGGGSRYDFAPLFAEIRPYVKDADLAFCHVEVPMTPAPPASYPVFNTPPELAEGIAATGWDACSTASNHTLDQGEEGIAETLRALDRAGVRHTGSATSAREQRKPLIIEAGGARVALLAYTGATNGIPLPRPYSLNRIEPRLILEEARRARRAGADAVIVNLHWTTNYIPEYVTDTTRKQHDLVDRLVGASEITAVVGQGPHVPQPVERVGGKLVVFSEGNLISNQGADVGLAAESQDGYVALLDLVVDGEGARVSDARYVPTWVDHLDYRVLPVGPALEAGEADPASLRASYERTVGIVGRGTATPVPARLP
jgi:poly-gamma-glutamate synthesis protein (capsule biosynthesis protein)